MNPTASVTSDPRAVNALTERTDAAPAAVAPPFPASVSPPTVEQLLYAEPYLFDFFQAVRLLERLAPAQRPIGRVGPPPAEVVRFKAHLSLSFPPSAIYDLKPAAPPGAPPPKGEVVGVPAMTVSFLGLHGPSGILPRHYTELLLRIDKEAKGPEKNALREWFDLFNHRFISLFYRAWEKYRFFIPYERGEYAGPEPDPYTLCLYSFVGLGQPPLRNRLRVARLVEVDGEQREEKLAHIDDLALLHYSGLLSHRPRCAVSLEAILADYFQLPLRILQFHGQWLCLDPANQSRLGGLDGNNQLGVSVVAGERVWDVQSKFRVRLGPLDFAQFLEFLPDRAPVRERKAFFLMSHLVRLYVGPEFDFEVQLVLNAEDVPECQLTETGIIGPRLGWNTWIRSLPFPHDAEEAVFVGEELVFIDQKG